MSFILSATKVIRDSIQSSIYIDDKIVEPFEAQTATNKAEFKISKDLHSSFRKENKSLDFYRFEAKSDWKNDADYLLRNRDLVILDWQLNEDQDLMQLHTLNILKGIVEMESLHFVSIYTFTPKSDFPKIFHIIRAYFDTKYSTEAHAKCEEIVDLIESWGVDSNFFDPNLLSFRELALGVKTAEALNTLDTAVRTAITNHYGEFREKLRGLSKVDTEAWAILGYYLHKLPINHSPIDGCEINTQFLKSKFIVINQTIIQLTDKSNPKPAKHFEFFTKALQTVCGNVLTLTSLDIRNLMRKSSGFIGKDADSVDECVLHLHQTQNPHFFDFLVEIWKGQMLSLLDYNADSLETLNSPFWDNYVSARKLEKKLEKLKKKSVNYHNEIAKLNVFYNSLRLGKDVGTQLRFGDVFSDLEITGTPSDRYWLNITAHCDCLRPDLNIKNNFYFVLGFQKPLEELLKEGEDGHQSYLQIEGEVVAIKWNNRPTILNIPVCPDKSIFEATDGLKSPKTLKYVGTLKENYAQRMANNSFSFAMRVGIDFAGTK